MQLESFRYHLPKPVRLPDLCSTSEAAAVLAVYCAAAAAAAAAVAAAGVGSEIAAGAIVADAEAAADAGTGTGTGVVGGMLAMRAAGTRAAGRKNVVAGTGNEVVVADTAGDDSCALVDRIAAVERLQKAAEAEVEAAASRLVSPTTRPTRRWCPSPRADSSSSAQAALWQEPRHAQSRSARRAAQPGPACVCKQQ